jgi:hypothetical protein
VVLDAEESRAGELGRRDRGVVGALGVDDDDVEGCTACVREHARKARTEPAAAVRRHDDDGEVGHGTVI